MTTEQGLAANAGETFAWKVRYAWRAHHAGDEFSAQHEEKNAFPKKAKK